MVHLNVHNLPTYSNIVYVGRQSFYIDFSTENNRVEICVEKLFDITGAISFRAELNGLCVDNASEVFYWALDEYKRFNKDKVSPAEDDVLNNLSESGFDIVKINCKFLDL